MDRITAPYGFVPVSEHVFRPPWAPVASQDMPFEDGLCGRLRLRIHAESPIFVRGVENPAAFYSTPDGPAIPGSGVRGLLRNVIEIASFGWLRRVNDHRYGVRDLHNQDLYVRHMAGIQRTAQGENRPLPRVIAGWLRRVPTDETGLDAIVATIEPCHFAKIDYRVVRQLTGVRHDLGAKQRSVDKYHAWGQLRPAVQVAVKPLRLPEAVRLPFGFGEVTGPGNIPGTLVFTGQPAPWHPDQAPRRGGGHPKHHDFVFYGREPGATIPVSRRIFDGFEFVHSDRGQQNRLDRSMARNPEWSHWGQEYDRGADVPVFFLLDEERSTSRRPVLRAFGLAMMFRLAYDYSVGEAVRRAQPAQREFGDQLDLAETLFGHVPSRRPDLPDERLRALKGRVSVGLARAEGQPRPMAPVTAVLGTPKASYYPNYVEQQGGAPGMPAARGPDGKLRYRTWMDADARPRGWKRYRPQKLTVTPPLLRRGDGRAMDLSRVATTFAPLPAGTTFSLDVRLHNVRQAELGALLWALDFGGEPECRHTLGLARGLGYGVCRFEILGVELRDMADQPFTDLDAARRAYCDLMEEFATRRGIPGGWAGSRALFELRALARPLPAGSPDGRHLLLDHPEDRNQFQLAKLRGLALPPAGDEAAWRASVGIKSGVGPSNAVSAGRPPITSARPALEPARPPAWAGIKGGTQVRVTLLGLSKRGKWRARLLDHPGALGVIGFGEAPPDAVEGKEYSVTVTAGGNQFDVQMRW